MLVSKWKEENSEKKWETVPEQYLKLRHKMRPTALCKAISARTFVYLTFQESCHLGVLMS